MLWTSIQTDYNLQNMQYGEAERKPDTWDKPLNRLITWNQLCVGNAFGHFWDLFFSVGPSNYSRVWYRLHSPSMQKKLLNSVDVCLCVAGSWVLLTPGQSWKNGSPSSGFFSELTQILVKVKPTDILCFIACKHYIKITNIHKLIFCFFFRGTVRWSVRLIEWNLSKVNCTTRGNSLGKFNRLC